MSSPSMSLHPPYALPGIPLPDASRAGSFPVPASTPFVPPAVRVVSATSRIDEPEAAELAPGPVLGTPQWSTAVAPAEEALPSIDDFVVDDQPAADEEAWAIADAGEEVAQLAEGLGAASAASAPGTVAPQPALDPWAEDERWMDIMPTLNSPGSPDLAAETAWARAFAEPPAPLPQPVVPAGDAAAAAAALEVVARRLRAGELAVPGFRADSGDAAALAAVLASLLGARR
jgi:hypothetical protein